MAVDSNLTRVPLKGALEGHSITVDEDKLTIAVLEEYESTSMVRTRQAIEAIIVETDLAPKIEDLSSVIRAMGRLQFRSLLEGVQSYISLPKS